ncbi:hypothetical protein [Amycolatopsis sp. DSM 110486]|uniref:hypothetical protein n=1 Tax=Amycolatopsis sp. DSM 110486 TaxID=2865832 RepID=UPI001C69EB03|nr:hypothetical protein [Amycolatopsis sp. DSM 110486]QYN17454.1 hypothetical protein K1T34_32220 [Amycolatopsis sp. DSM 110486]
MTRRWGKAGVPLTDAETRRNDARRNKTAAERVLADQRTYREWRAGKVVPWRITLALDSHALYGPEVDEACGAAEPDVDMWEAGTRYPTWEQLKKLAKLTMVTPGFFMIRPAELLPAQTSMQFHRIGGERAEWRQPPPVLLFTPEAIAETVRGAD